MLLGITHLIYDNVSTHALKICNQSQKVNDIEDFHIKIKSTETMVVSIHNPS
jgi:hypothetical protein